jgi:hypothetical protein
MRKIYIAGALNSDAVGYIKNMHVMLRHADMVRRSGFAVYVPCTDFMMGLVIGNYQYRDYFDNSQPFLLCCEAVYVCPGWKKSEGTKREIAAAQSNNIPVFYDIKDLCMNLL